MTGISALKTGWKKKKTSLSLPGGDERRCYLTAGKEHTVDSAHANPLFSELQPPKL